MAKPSEKTVDYEKRARAMHWHDIDALWQQILSGATPGWDSGKALEYLVVRGFQLNGMQVAYPFDVPPGGKQLEQVDGMVEFDSVMFLLECKDKDKEDIAPIANLDHMLKRRPQTTMACLFVVGALTQPAMIRLEQSPPHRILVWQQNDIENAISQRSFKATLRSKYNILRQFGMFDHSEHYRDLEEA